MAAANDLRKGMAIKYNGNTAIVLEVHHRTPGNLRAFVQAIIRYINTGKSADVRFGSTDKVELVDINRDHPRVQLQGQQRITISWIRRPTRRSRCRRICSRERRITSSKILPVEVLYAEGKAGAGGIAGIGAA